MHLKFQVLGQRILRKDQNYVVAGARGCMTAAFSFSSEWDGKIKTAIFAKGNTVYHAVLVSDAISAEQMPVLSDGVWQVSVFGGDLITSDSAALPVFPSGFREENVPAAPQVSVYETITALIQENIDKVEALASDIADSAPLEVRGETLYIG